MNLVHIKLTIFGTISFAFSLMTRGAGQNDGYRYFSLSVRTKGDSNRSINIINFYY